VMNRSYHPQYNVKVISSTSSWNRKERRSRTINKEWWTSLVLLYALRCSLKIEERKKKRKNERKKCFCFLVF
jgi:hypothetical protein